APHALRRRPAGRGARGDRHRRPPAPGPPGRGAGARARLPGHPPELGARPPHRTPSRTPSQRRTTMKATTCLLALAAATCTTAPAADKVIAARCAPSAATELTCGDGVDNDCDGFIDCLDPDCGGQTCGGAGLTCMAGASR